jgi:hypothetical protein
VQEKLHKGRERERERVREGEKGGGEEENNYNPFAGLEYYFHNKGTKATAKGFSIPKTKLCDQII